MNNTFSQLTKKICETKKKKKNGMKKNVSSIKSKIQKDILIKFGKKIWFYPRLCFGVFKSIHATTQTKHV